MNKETEVMVSLVDILTEAGWVARSRSTEASIEVEWTTEGEKHMRDMLEILSLPKLTTEQQKFLRFLAVRDFGGLHSPPPNFP